MRAYRIETTVERDGELALRQLPLKAGETVEVIVLAEERVNGKRQAASGFVTIRSSEKSKRRRAALARISSGMYAYKSATGMLPSEEFAMRKAEEKALEERRWK